MIGRDHMVLTCQDCGGDNLRPLPYSCVTPDKCDHCPAWFRTRFSVALMRYRQSKIESVVEAVVNTFIGLLIAFAAQWLICWVYNIPLSARQNLIIVFWMTVLSILRSYAVRRIANSEFWKRRKNG